MSRSDDRYDTYEYYRSKDEFYREQDLRYEHFQDDLRWKQKTSARRHEFAREAIKEGNTPWALHKPTPMRAYLGRGRCYQAIGKLKHSMWLLTNALVFGKFN